MELCDETLQKFLEKKGKALSESEALKIGSQILSGMCALHGKNISHRDLKFDNILVKDGV